MAIHSTNKSKLVCNLCDWHGDSDVVLKAPNPFESSETIYGCPGCRSAESVEAACDEVDCWSPATCGFPASQGYRNVCGKHWRHHEWDT